MLSNKANHTMEKAKIIFSGGQLSKWIKQIILFTNYKKLIYKENDKIFT